LPAIGLLLLSTGTGLAPLPSSIKDPDVYERFETIVLVPAAGSFRTRLCEELVASCAMTICSAAAVGEAALLIRP